MPAGGSKAVPHPTGLAFFKDKWLVRLNLSPGSVLGGVPLAKRLAMCSTGRSKHSCWGDWGGLWEPTGVVCTHRQNLPAMYTPFSFPAVSTRSPITGIKDSFLYKFWRTCKRLRGAGLQAGGAGGSWTKVWFQLMLSFKAEVLHEL